MVASSAASIYHGLEVRLEKRFSQGLSFLSSYTYSKAIDDSSAQFGNYSDENFPQDSHNLAAERGPSNFDARHRWVLSHIYELPFGPKRRYWNQATGLAGKLLEVWQVNGIWVFQSGQPYTPALGFDNSNTETFQDRPNKIGDPYASGSGCSQTRTPNCWVNPAAFAASAPGTFGNAGRGSLIGPGVKSIDFSLFKNTSFAEGRMVQFRAEFFNLANHPNFDNPIRTLGPTFGQIQSAGVPRQIQFGLRFVF